MKRETKVALYLGLTPVNCRYDGQLVHYPVIAIRPRPLTCGEVHRAFSKILSYSHFLFTSKTTVRLFSDQLLRLKLSISDLRERKFIAVGKATAMALTAAGFPAALTPDNETAEGLTALLDTLDLQDASVFWPHSAQARSVLIDYFKRNSLSLHHFPLYDTVTQSPYPKPDLADIDDIIFTSPSTVDGFLAAYPNIPSGKRFITLGPVTEARLKQTASLQPILTLSSLET